MGNCCGPFKRGRPATAVNPAQQCFADCCGNLCPPEGCCDYIKVGYECGCGCECDHTGFNFSGLRFKKKKSRTKIPKFSKKTLSANGFTFSDGTVPTGSSSSSSSSSSSCICSPFNVELKTDGCCLYMGPEGVEAVGPGVVTATQNGSPPYGCEIEVLLNGLAVPTIDVEDGELINLEIRPTGDCQCCETQRECVTPSTGLWIQKSNENGRTIVLNKDAIREKVRLAVERVKKRRRGSK